VVHVAILPYLGFIGLMGYWKLLLTHPRTLAYGFTLAFFSGLGQTHFIALFNPTIMETYSLSHSQYGSLYSLITLLTGFLITFVGPMIDRYDLRIFALITGMGLMLSQTFLAIESSFLTLVIGLFGLRFFGQGLCSSLSSISIARYFEVQRGTALSISQLGYPVFEGIITPFYGWLILYWSYSQISWSLVFFVGAVFLPLTYLLTLNLSEFNQVPLNSAGSYTDQKDFKKNWTRKDVLNDRTLYLLLPQTLMPPFALTGLFFHQSALAHSKGWSLTLMASGLFFFALGRILNTFVTGPLVDKWQAFRLFPYYQLPLSLGFYILGHGQSLWVPGFSFFLFGLTVGSGGPIKSAIWAELYGVRHLGAIKSLFATLMILSTALSPALFGFIIDFNGGVTTLLSSLLIISLVSALLSALTLRSFRLRYSI